MANHSTFDQAIYTSQNLPICGSLGRALYHHKVCYLESILVRKWIELLGKFTENHSEIFHKYAAYINHKQYHLYAFCENVCEMIVLKCWYNASGGCASR